MKIKPTDKLAEIKERFFARLNTERQNMIRQRRQSSGYGTYAAHESKRLGSRKSGIFDNPCNRNGLISKQTKLAAQEVD